MKYRTEGMEILVKYLVDRGFSIQRFEEMTDAPTIIKIYGPNNRSAFRPVTRKASCICGKCESTEILKVGAYVNVCAFGERPSIIGVGFTEDGDETWESYDLHTPDALKTIEERILWGLEDWTEEKTKRRSWRDHWTRQVGGR